MSFVNIIITEISPLFVCESSDNYASNVEIKDIVYNMFHCPTDVEEDHDGPFEFVLFSFHVYAIKGNYTIQRLVRL